MEYLCLSTQEFACSNGYTETKGSPYPMCSKASVVFPCFAQSHAKDPENALLGNVLLQMSILIARYRAAASHSLIRMCTSPRLPNVSPFGACLQFLHTLKDSLYFSMAVDRSPRLSKMMARLPRCILSRYLFPISRLI